MSANGKLILKTSRLLLRTFEDSDIKAFIAYRNDSEIAKYQSWDIPYPETAARELVKYVQQTKPGVLGEWYQIAIALKATNEIIGDCGFCILAEDSQQAEIGFTLASNYHGFGYASEAVTCLLEYLFTEFQLHYVRANCDPANIASITLLERVGMQREGDFIHSLWYELKNPQLC